LINYYCFSLSIIIDFLVKSTGSGHANMPLIKQLPLLIDESKFHDALHVRVLSLTCLTTDYSELWRECWSDSFTKERWAKTDRRLL